MGRFMALSKNLFQGILNKGLRMGFSRIPRGVLLKAVEPFPPHQSTFESLIYVSKKSNLGHVYNFALCSEKTE